jgi:4-hydroxybenzoate polyprenyltransferase
MANARVRVSSLTRRRDRLFGRVEIPARLIRVFSMGATISYALVGSATANGTLSIGRILGVVCLGVTSHSHAAVFNDVIDYPIDRTEPRRADSPLVRGDIGRGWALGFSLFGFALSAGIMIVLAASGEAWLAWCLSFVLVDTYSLLGKKLEWAVLSDGVQGIGTACFVWVGAALTGEVTAATVAAMAYVVGYVMMINGVHGTVRDLANDAAHGARTTGLMFGAHIDADGTAVLPGPFVAWAVGLQVWLLAAASALFLLSRDRMAPPAAFGAIISGLVLAAIVLRLGNASLTRRSDRPKMMESGTWHLFFALALLVGVAVWMMPWWAAIITLVAFILPPKLFGWAVAAGASDG